MTDPVKRDAFSLKRWSQRKLEAARRTESSNAEPAPSAGVAAPSLPAAAPATATDAPPALPPLDSLTIDSDFAAFLRPDVDESLKRGALRKLFSNPHFNVMDGLDVYIDDYSKPDPISPELVRELVQARYLFDPPATRVNADGHVEDVASDERAPQALPAESPAPPEPCDASAPTIDGQPLPNAPHEGADPQSR